MFIEGEISGFESKNIEVTYDASKINELDIHNVIASSGYDTEKVTGDLSAYKKLPECCQYDHVMEINKSSL